LAPIEAGIVAWYFLYWDLFPKYSVRRLLPWLIFIIITGIGIPLLQISVYRSITSLTKIDDPFVFLVIFFESVTSAALAFYILVKRRKRGKMLRS
jgi:hypothetical protein